MTFLSAPPSVRKSIRSTFLLGCGLIVLDLVWGALSAPALDALATALGRYDDPIVGLFTLVTHVVVELGTPLGSVLVGVAMLGALITNFIDRENQKRVL
ncbi:hypothetical protein [Microbacterium sp. 1262]|uniref:hypothetical protein n=1 Tax=Microbacterium sp. 1262 TaxID=3156415 RepID=UPI00339B5191